MKVKQLIRLLSEYPPSANVRFWRPPLRSIYVGRTPNPRTGHKWLSSARRDYVYIPIEVTGAAISPVIAPPLTGKSGGVKPKLNQSKSKRNKPSNDDT